MPIQATLSRTSAGVAQNGVLPRAVWQTAALWQTKHRRVACAHRDSTGERLAKAGENAGRALVVHRTAVDGCVQYLMATEQSYGSAFGGPPYVDHVRPRTLAGRDDGAPHAGRNRALEAGALRRAIVADQALAQHDIRVDVGHRPLGVALSHLCALDG